MSEELAAEGARSHKPALILAGAVASLLAILLVVNFTSEGGARQTASGPNLLLILTDDQADGSMKWMPRMKRILLKQGVAYENGFVTTPLCCPSRGSIFSGQYIHNHGIIDNVSGEELDTDQTWQRVLSDNGYRTALVGKYLNGLNGEQESFDLSGAGLGISDSSKRFDANRLRIAREYLSEFEQDDQVPWAMQVSIHAPHSPFDPPPKYQDIKVGSYDRNPATAETDLSDKAPVMREAVKPAQQLQKYHAGHARTLRIADDLLVKFWNRLKKIGERENTLIIFMSDNGFALGEHGLLSKDKPYAPVVGVPFYMVWERELEPARSDDLVANIDIAPTFFDAAGIDPGYTLDGQTLLDEEERSYLYLESSREAAREDAWWDAYIDKDEHYIRWLNDDWSELYDRQADPWQLDADNEPRPDLELLMDEAATCEGSACP